MSNKTTPLEQRLVNAMKDAGFATKKDVEEIVHNQLTEHHHNMVQPEFNKVDERLNKVEVRLDKIEDQFDGLKAEFSNTPSKKEFSELKSKIDKYHPLN